MTSRVPPGTLEPGHETILADILNVQQSRFLYVVGRRYRLTGKKSSMAMQNGTSSSGILWERAKELLRKEDYERLKIAIKTFSKARSLEGLCSDLLKIVNSRSKVDILTEVRRCLPKNQRNTFTRHCNELLKSEAALERGDLEKKRKMEAKELDRENRAANFQGSPAKKTRQNSEKAPSSRTEKKELQESNQPIFDCSKESHTLANKARKNADRLDIAKHTLGPHGEYKTVVLERKSLNQEFGFKIRGGTFHHPVITVAQVAKDSLADRQGLKTGDRIIRVNDQRCGRGDVDIVQVIGIIKAAEKIHLRIVSGGFPSKEGCNVQRNKLVGARAEGTDQKRLSVVRVYPNEDGWLGCCIRG